MGMSSPPAGEGVLDVNAILLWAGHGHRQRGDTATRDI